MLNLPFHLRQVSRCCPALSGVLLITALALAVRGGAQAPHSSQPALRATHIAQAAPIAAQAMTQTERKPISPYGNSYTAIGPTSISIQSPSDATISESGTAVYHITINPDDATKSYYAYIDSTYVSTEDNYMKCYDGADYQSLPYAVKFEAGVTYRDVTLKATKVSQGEYEVFAYKDGDVNKDYSAPLIVDGPHIESGIGQSIPISCIVPDNPIQAGVEGIDCTASVKGLYGAVQDTSAMDASKRKHFIPPTIVEVGCSDQKMYRPGKGLIANHKSGSNGWPARLKFPPHRRQARFSVEHTKGAVVGTTPTVQLIFYSIKYDRNGKETVSRSFSKPIRIVTVNMPLP